MTSLISPLLNPVLNSLVPKSAAKASLALAACVWLSLGSVGVWGAASDPALIKADRLAQQGQGRAARAIYQAFLAAHPADYDALMAMGRLADRQGDFSLARATFQKLLRLYPGDRAATLGMARTLSRRATALGKPDLSLAPLINEYFQQAALVNPDDPQLLTYRGEWALAQESMASASRDLQRAVVVDPASAEAWRALARYFLKTSQYPAARDAGLRAMDLDPNESDGYFMMAQLLAAAQKPDQALAYAQKSQALDMGVNPQRTLLIAQLLETLGRPEEAIGALERLSQEAPAYDEATLKLAWLRAAANHPEEAAQDYRRLFRQNPAREEEVWASIRRLVHERQLEAALLQLAPFYWLEAPQQREAFHVAASALTQEREMAPNSAALARQWLMRLDARFLQGTLSVADPLLALDRLKLSLVADPSLARAEATLTTILGQTAETSETALSANQALAAGEAFFLLQRYREARQQFDAIDGLDAVGFIRAVDRLESLGAIGSARSLADRALTLTPSPALSDSKDRLSQRQQRAIALIQDGNSFFREKRYAEARDAYRQAQTFSPDWETPPLRLADAYEMLKDPARAYQSYRLAVAMTPELLDSKGFAKKYRRLSRRFGGVEPAQTPPVKLPAR
ncbi:MAG: tetratricopeptide repeat protein [Vampirovibrionales bacterium]|nr:tetratricopeptide repeat protein [Vampirovibrionales bacterium]